MSGRVCGGGEGGSPPFEDGKVVDKRRFDLRGVKSHELVSLHVSSSWWFRMTSASIAP